MGSYICRLSKSRQGQPTNVRPHGTHVRIQSRPKIVRRRVPQARVFRANNPESTPDGPGERGRPVHQNPLMKNKDTQFSFVTSVTSCHVLCGILSCHVKPCH